MNQKIFGIGLSKTGTSSLNIALNLLGIKSVHHPWKKKIIRQFHTGDFSLSALEEYDAITEFVVPYFKDFDRMYPSSKFILTTRNIENWLNSIEAWYARGHWFMAEFRISVFGCYKFNRDHFRDVYNTHLMVVRHHFVERKKDLLELDICGGEGWDKLCPFLSRKIPAIPFPWENKQHK